jgi:hypothetical protein
MNFLEVLLYCLSNLRLSLLMNGDFRESIEVFQRSTIGLLFSSLSVQEFSTAVQKHRIKKLVCSIVLHSSVGKG